MKRKTFKSIVKKVRAKKALKTTTYPAWQGRACDAGASKLTMDMMQKCFEKTRDNGGAIVLKDWYHYCARRHYVIAHAVCNEMLDKGRGRTKCKKCEWRTK